MSLGDGKRRADGGGAAGVYRDAVPSPPPAVDCNKGPLSPAGAQSQVPVVGGDGWERGVALEVTRVTLSASPLRRGRVLLRERPGAWSKMAEGRIWNGMKVMLRCGQ